MEITEYLKEKNEIHRIILDFIEDENSLDEIFNNYLFLLQKYQGLEDNPQNLKETLHIISNIADNHSHQQNFFEKIERLLLIFKDKISEYFTNYQIFNIFKKNKRILLFLFENKILKADSSIHRKMVSEKYSKAFYPYYFFNDIKEYVNENKQKGMENFILKITDNDPLLFEQKRKIGENDNYVCQMIRNDLIDEFISYATQKNLSLFSTIKISIFESNHFLFNKNPSLIEYAAFCGSIQIFKYLFMNNVDLNSSLWLYAIHSQKPEFIHFLEENHINPEDKTFKECLKESIKCHHCDIAEYIHNNLIQNSDEKEKILLHLKYHNFAFNPTIDLNYKDLFYYWCRYDYISIVENALNEKDICINSMTISKKLNFFMKFE